MTKTKVPPTKKQKCEMAVAKAKKVRGVPKETQKLAKRHNLHAIKNMSEQQLVNTMRALPDVLGVAMRSTAVIEAARKALMETVKTTNEEILSQLGWYSRLQENTTVARIVDTIKEETQEYEQAKCNTRAETLQLANFFCEKGLPITLYHQGRTGFDRNAKVQVNILSIESDLSIRVHDPQSRLEVERMRVRMVPNSPHSSYFQLDRQMPSTMPAMYRKRKYMLQSRQVKTLDMRPLWNKLRDVLPSMPTPLLDILIQYAQF
jgi:hypothetical protein